MPYTAPEGWILSIKSNKVSNLQTWQLIIFINKVNAIDNSSGATKFENQLYHLNCLFRVDQHSKYKDF